MVAISSRFDDLGADGSPRKLAVMGGTFDPIHIGHLNCAEQAREAFRLDAVLFVPAGRPVFKKGKHVTDPRARLEMCELATRSNPFFDVSSIEVDRAGDTFTVDTLRQLRAHYPENVELFFIVGADALASIASWHESEQMAGLAHFIALARPGFELLGGSASLTSASSDGTPLAGAFSKDALDKSALSFAEAGKLSRFSISYLDVAPLSVSSSCLRERAAAGKSIRYLTPSCVREYIEAHGLYRYPDASLGCDSACSGSCSEQESKSEGRQGTGK